MIELKSVSKSYNISISAIFTIALAVFTQRMYFKAVISGQEVEA
ncbi:hypothetical protein [Thermoanaerobacter mathranii]